MRVRVRAFVAIVVGGVAVTSGLAWAHAGHVPLATGARADSVIVEKAAHRLLLFGDGRLLKTYRVALGRGGLAAKEQEGDLRVPEGRYTIDRRLEESAFHRALHVSYPDSTDVERARTAGVSAGHSIMIHGIRNGAGWVGRLHRLADWTAGCVAVTNREIEELWRAIPDGTPVVLRP